MARRRAGRMAVASARPKVIHFVRHGQVRAPVFFLGGGDASCVSERHVQRRSFVREVVHSP